MKRDEALKLLAEHREELAELGVESLALFGSVARDEAGPDSDIDVLVELSRRMGAFEFLDIHERLEEIFGRDVDVVTTGGLRGRFRERVMRDVVHVS
jgi:uncharacterized protein